MAKPKIYTTGGTVQVDNGIYLEREADQELLDLCLEGKFAYILACRQIGKSSLMVKTAKKLSEKGIRSLIIDLSGHGFSSTTAEHWYQTILFVMNRELRLKVDTDQWWQSYSYLSFTQRLLLFFEEVLLVKISKPVVIFIDEIDVARQLTFSDDFFAAIRYVYNNRHSISAFERLSFVLIGAVTPSNLIRNPNITPFNIGHPVSLTDFTLKEAMPLADGLGVPEAQKAQVMEWILKQTGGHPYLTQRLCSELANARQKLPAEIRKVDVEYITKEAFLGSGSERGSNLNYVRQMLLNKDVLFDSESILKTYQEVREEIYPVYDEEQSEVKEYLKLSGVVRQAEASLFRSRSPVLAIMQQIAGVVQRKPKKIQATETVLQVRNQIYREVFNQRWISEHLPESWWKRHRDILPLVGALVGYAITVSGLGVSSYLATQKADRATKVAELHADASDIQAAIASQEGEEINNLIRAINVAARSRELAPETEGSAVRSLESALAASREQNKMALPSSIDTLAFKPDGLLAIGDNNGSLYLWDLQNKLDGPFQIHSQYASSLAFSSSGSQIITGSRSDTWTRVWDLDKLLKLGTSNKLELSVAQFDTSFGSSIKSVAFSRNGKIASGGGDRTVRVWNQVNQQASPQVFSAPDKVQAIAFSPDGKWIAAGADDGQVTLWNLTQDQRKPPSIPRRYETILSVAFSSNGKMIASGATDGIVTLSSLQESKGKDSLSLYPLKQSEKAYTVAFSPDTPSCGSRSYLAVGRGVLPDDNDRASDGSGTVRLWKIDQTDFQKISPELVWTSPNVGPVYSVAFSPDCKGLASAGQDGVVRFWDLTDVVEPASDETPASHRDRLLATACRRLQYHPIFNSERQAKEQDVTKEQSVKHA
ncbi:MAG: AAA-like domain-containing protein, partial [Elainella sp.]